MFDLEFHLENRPSALAELGEAMGRAGIPFEGGEVFSYGIDTVVDFLAQLAYLAFRDAGPAHGFDHRLPE